MFFYYEIICWFKEKYVFISYFYESDAFFYSFSDGDEMVWRGYPEKYGLMSQVFMMKISSLNRQTYIVNEKK